MLDDDDDFRAFVGKFVNGEEYDKVRENIKRSRSCADQVNYYQRDWHLFLVMCENGEHELLADAAEIISADLYGAALHKYAGVTEKYVLLAIPFVVQQLPKEGRGDLLWRALGSSRDCSCDVRRRRTPPRIWWVALFFLSDAKWLTHVKLPSFPLQTQITGTSSPPPVLRSRSATAPCRPPAQLRSGPSSWRSSSANIGR